MAVAEKERRRDIYIEGGRERKEDGTSKLKFALFSRGSAIVPACHRALSNPQPSSACPKNPSTCTRASLFIQKFSRQHFPLLRRRHRRRRALPTFHFCLLLAPRAFRHVSSLTSRLISSNPSPFPHHPLTPPHRQTRPVVPSYRHRINYLSTRTVAVLSPSLHPPPTRESFVLFPCRRRRRRRFVYSFSLFNFTDLYTVRPFTKILPRIFVRIPLPPFHHVCISEIVFFVIGDGLESERLGDPYPLKKKTT